MQESGSQNLLTLYSDVRATPVRWLWYPYIAVGKITLLQGDPGDGKSTMILNLISEISKGGKTPDGKALGIPQRVIYQCSEDDTADTIKPRLESCGADCRNVAFINEETHNGLTLDDERIRQVIINFRPCLVVIDPIQAYLGNDSDLQIAGRARKLMQRLGMWASVYDCAVILIGHLNKKEGSKDLYRSLGSIDLIAAARSVLQMERDSGDPDVRMYARLKIVWRLRVRISALKSGRKQAFVGCHAKTAYKSRCRWNVRCLKPKLKKPHFSLKKSFLRVM